MEVVRVTNIIRKIIGIQILNGKMFDLTVSSVLADGLNLAKYVSHGPRKLATERWVKHPILDTVYNQTITRVRSHIHFYYKSVKSFIYI